MKAISRIPSDSEMAAGLRRAGGADREARASLVETIARRTDATLVQSVGKVMILWRPRPESESVSAQPHGPQRH